MRSRRRTTAAIFIRAGGIDETGERVKIGVVGPSYNQISLPFDAQRSINFYAVLDQMGKEVAALYGTPGLVLFTNLGNAPIREMFNSTTGRAFAICGSNFYEVDVAGVGTKRGTLDQSSGICYMAENAVQLVICDGTSLYVFTYATNTYQKIVGGLEYVNNGNFTSGTGWTTGSGWSISGGAANASSASSDLTTTAAFTIKANTAYTIEYTITVSSGTVTPKVGGVAGVTRTGAGTYTEVITTGASPTQAITFTGASFTGTLTAITMNDPAFGLPSSIGTITFLDSFILASQNDTGHFFKSAPNDATSWNALDFATAESSPDNLVRVIAAIGQLWLMGTDTGEIWTDTGAALFPFQKISGGKMTMGIMAPATAIELDNTLFWVGANEQGESIVFRASGFIPRRVSTTPIETAIRLANDQGNIRAFAYQEDGHVFYVLTGGGLATSLVYDITTDLWHERAFLNSQGAFEQHLGCCHMRAFGKQLVGDRNTGNIYILDVGTYDDNGNPLVSERIYTHLSDEDKRTRYNRLVIGAEPGVGNQTGLGTDPVIEMRLSKDGALTWSQWYSAPLGKAGNFKNKARFRRLGVAEQMTFAIRISEPVKRAIVGSYLQ